MTLLGPSTKDYINFGGFLMLKKFKRIVVTILILTFVNIGLSRCYGSYVMTKKVHRWNGTLGNEWVKSGVNILVAVFVYWFTGLVDFLILNTLEFWTGSNPLAMGPGESETQIAEFEGQKVKITATQNRFDITYLNGEKKGEVVALVYNPETSSWYTVKGDKTTKVAEMLPGNQKQMVIFHPDGQKLVVNL